MFFLPSLTTLLPQWNKEGGFKKGQYPGLRMICESKGPLAMSLSVNRAHPSLMLSTLLAIITARVSYLFKLLCKNKKQPQFSLFETRAKPSQCNPCASLLKTARNLLKTLSIVWTRSLPFNLLSSHQSNHEQWDCQCLADGVGTANEAALQSSVYGGNDWLLQLIRNSTLLWVFSKRFLLSCVVTEFVLTDIPHFFIETMSRQIIFQISQFYPLWLSLIICCCFMSAVEISKSAIKIKNYLAWNYTNKNFMRLLSALCKWMNWKINTYFTPVNICGPNVRKHCDDKSDFIFKSFALTINSERSLWVRELKLFKLWPHLE